MHSDSHAMSALDLDGLRALHERATKEWVVYSEPDVGLPPSLFAGCIGQTGFGPIEPLEGYDLQLAAAMHEQLPALLGRISTLEREVMQAREAGQFLLDRLVDHEVRMMSDEDSREWHGHVTSAMARFRAALHNRSSEGAS